MKKHEIIVTFALIVLLFIGYFAFQSKKEKNESWNTFVDAVNEWEIDYPPNVTTVELTDDKGPKNWLANVVFKEEDHWIFSVWVGNADQVKNLNIELPDPKEKVFKFVRNNMLFIIRAYDGAPLEKILESLETES